MRAYDRVARSLEKRAGLPCGVCELPHPSSAEDIEIDKARCDCECCVAPWADWVEHHIPLADRARLVTQADVDDAIGAEIGRVDAEIARLEAEEAGR